MVSEAQTVDRLQNVLRTYSLELRPSETVSSAYKRGKTILNGGAGVKLLSPLTKSLSAKAKCFLYLTEFIEGERPYQHLSRNVLLSAVREFNVVHCSVGSS